tara:strand:- start:9386 stop:9550 length:165 start_codon:yes stop_codon:yes gene_type:complete
VELFSVLLATVQAPPYLAQFGVISAFDLVHQDIIPAGKEPAGQTKQPYQAAVLD